MSTFFPNFVFQSLKYFRALLGPAPAGRIRCKPARARISSLSTLILVTGVLAIAPQTAHAAVTPVITSATTATGQVGVAFSYQITCYRFF